MGISHLDEFERERKLLIENRVAASRAYEKQEDGKEILASEFIYNDSGYIQRLSLGLSTLSPTIEEYTYNEDYIVVETKRGFDSETMKVVRTKEFKEHGSLEIDKEFVNRDIYISEYKNDSFGRNISKRYLKNDSLIATYQFHWSEYTQPDSIIVYSPKGEIIGRMLNQFSNGNLIQTEKYENEILIYKNSIRYNSNGLREKEVAEVPDDYKDVLEIEYQNGLRFEERSKYTSLNSDYSSERTLIWKYEKRK